MINNPFPHEISTMSPLLIGLMIGLGVETPGFDTVADRSSGVLTFGDFFGRGGGGEDFFGGGGGGGGRKTRRIRK